MTDYMKSSFKIMVIGGTSDSRIIIDKLLENHFEVIVTVATSYGESLLQERSGLQVFQGRMDEEQLKDFMEKQEISCVVDASHPFAANVSLNALKACQRAGIDYIRFERESCVIDLPDVLIAENYEEAAIISSKLKGNIFLTTGSNNLEDFTKNIPDYVQRLYVRVLPESSVILKCEKLGLTAENIIAMKGPFTKDLNIAMLKQCNAAVMVTKESGDAGGFIEKISSARELGIKVVMIKRPKLQYKNIFSNTDGLILYVFNLRDSRL